MLDSNSPAAARPVVPQPGKTILSGSDIDTGVSAKAMLLGIDLGTSRSSIVSYSGTRKTVETYVGFPKDAVSRKFLKQDVVFGKAALDNRLAVDLYRPLEKGVIKGSEEANNDPTRRDKNLQAAKLLLKHLVDLASPGRDEMLFGVIGVPSLATQKNKQAILEIARQVLDSVMIVSEPFTVAYGMEKMADVLVIDIGAGTTDLCRMHGTVPTEEDEVSYTVAGDAVDQKLHDLIMARYPRAQITVNMCKSIKEGYGFVSDTKDRVIVTFPEDGKPSPHDVTDEVKGASEILVAPIVEGIQKLVSSFNPEFQERLRHNVILSGGGGLMRGLNKRIEDAMKEYGGARVTVVDEPLYAGANGALQLAIDMPGEYWQQLR
ncbi:MAG TPA: MamK family actin-like protein [Tepidisphaeraceae bacterium]|jgi:rod shape-determining protein MreB|nr:MamK family actin-like protein [Tepidisphaeraceae bacterium]